MKLSEAMHPEKNSPRAVHIDLDLFEVFAAEGVSALRRSLSGSPRLTRWVGAITDSAESNESA